MRILTLLATLILTSTTGSTQNAYEIKANIKPYKTGYLYLAYHFGSKQYLLDSAKIDPSGNAVFSGAEKLPGGIYMIVFPAKNGWVECVVDQQQRFSVAADSSDLINSLSYEGSSDNTIFGSYQKKSAEIGSQINALRNQMKGKPGDPAFDEANAKMKILGKEMQDYRENLQRQHPTHLLSAIFNLLKEPVIPEASEHPGGKYDSVFAYQFYKNNYWDGLSLTDARLMRTPVLQPKFDRYYDEIVPQSTDSIIRYADEMLAEAKPNDEMFKFVLSSLTDKYVNPKFMGLDAVFVHLFEKYYMTGQADSWMNEKYRKFIFDRGYSLMGNILGKKAAELPMVDTLGKNFSLYTVQAPFTVICFWDPTCGHCKEEVPKVDSMFQAKWKQGGIKLIGVMTDGGIDNWLNYIREHKLNGWIHIYQTEEIRDKIAKAGAPGYRQLYDVYQTPVMYLLDKDKNIIAKKINYKQIDDFIDHKKRSGK